VSPTAVTRGCTPPCPCLAITWHKTTLPQMLQTPSPSGSSALVNTALRNAGLMDRDERMRDAADKPGGRKGFPKSRPHRPRLIDSVKGQPGPTRNSMVNIRLLLPPSSPVCAINRCLVLASFRMITQNSHSSSCSVDSFPRCASPAYHPDRFFFLGST